MRPDPKTIVLVKFNLTTEEAKVHGPKGTRILEKLVWKRKDPDQRFKDFYSFDK